MGDLRKRVGMVNEMRKMRGKEELKKRRRRRIRVDEVMRNESIDLDRGNKLIDREINEEKKEEIMVLNKIEERKKEEVEEIVDVVDIEEKIEKLKKNIEKGKDILIEKKEKGVLRVEVKKNVNIKEEKGRKVVELGIEEKRMENGIRRINSRRLKRKNEEVDVEKWLMEDIVIVERKSVEDIRKDIEMVDIEKVDLSIEGIDKGIEKILIDLVKGLEINIESWVIEEILRKIREEKIVLSRIDGIEEILGKMIGRKRGKIIEWLKKEIESIGIKEIGDDINEIEELGGIRNEKVIEVKGIGESIVESGKNLLEVNEERNKKSSGRKIEKKVDERIEDVIGIEIDIEKRKEIRNEERRKKKIERRMGIEIVMIEEEERRKVNMRKDKEIGEVEDEGEVVGNERNIENVKVMIIDVIDGIRKGVLVNIEKDKKKSKIERRRISKIEMKELIKIEIRWIELVEKELENGREGEIMDREKRIEKRMKKIVRKKEGWLLKNKEMVVRWIMKIDKVRNIGEIGDIEEKFE